MKDLPEVDKWFESLRMYGAAAMMNNDNGWISWPGIPYSRTDRNNFDDIYRLIDNAIALSPIEMCLTSKYEYIRGCKKWLIENNQDGVKLRDPYAEEEIIEEEDLS